MQKPYVFSGHGYRTLAQATAWTQQYQEPVLEPALEIIDPHHHVWDDQRGRYLAHELAADTGAGHNIVATVFVEAGVMYRASGPAEMKPIGEVEFVNGMAAMGAAGHFGKTRLCAGIVGHADLMLGAKVAPVLEALTAAGNGRFKGIRYGTIWDTGDAAKFGRHQVPRHLMADATFRAGFAELAPRDLSFEAWLFYPQLDDLAELLTVFPDTRVVLNHCGGLLGIAPHEDRAAVFETWSAHIRKLARFPNLNVKVGGLGMLYCNWDFHLNVTPPSSRQLADTWRPYAETCIEEFGANRCMLESNFPPDKQTCGYGVLWNAFKRITEKYSDAEKADLYRDTAARFYKLEV